MTRQSHSVTKVGVVCMGVYTHIKMLKKELAWPQIGSLELLLINYNVIQNFYAIKELKNNPILSLNN